MVSIAGLVLIPMGIILLLVDILTIELVETIFVLFAENISSIPALSGTAWAYTSLVFVLISIVWFLVNNFFAAVAFFYIRNRHPLMFGSLSFESQLENLPFSEIRKIIRLIPESTEDALSISLHGVEQRDEDLSEKNPTALPPLYHLVLEMVGND